MNVTPERLALLRAAYPAGYLAKRGVLTVGGWNCLRARVDANVAVMTFSRPPVCDVTGGLSYCAAGVPLTLLHTPAGDLGGAPVTEWQIICDAHARGDLLPDLTDPATWTLALIDLAEASGLPTFTEFLVWKRESLRGSGAVWRLGTVFGSLGTVFDIATKDPIEALLLARASLRGKEATP